MPLYPYFKIEYHSFLKNTTIFSLSSDAFKACRGFSSLGQIAEIIIVKLDRITNIFCYFKFYFTFYGKVLQ